MKAAVWHGAKDIRIEEVNLKPLASDEVTIKVAYAGICGSDLHEYQEGPVLIPTTFPDPLTNEAAPIVLGHEFSGVVEAVGTDVYDFQVGDHVAVNPAITKRESPDDVDVYDGYSFIGLSNDGGLAPYVNVSVQNLYHLPQNFSLKSAAVMEPAAVAVQAVKETDLSFGQTVVIFGAGPIGVLLAEVARAAGASRIVVVDLAEVRLQKALEIGATDTVNASQVVDVEQKIAQILPDGADVSFEVAGVQETFDKAVAVTKPRGFVVVVSIFPQPIRLDIRKLMNAGVRIVTSIAYSRQTFQQTVDLVISGQLKVEPLITSEIRLADFLKKGLLPLIGDPSEEKILVNLTKSK
ncbi:Sorbitol dehydrogenase [Fructobacillus sp. EFB-N1]|uniref:2,3-butanediol dehydrogenase n=1 Tax=Fructobacillus sp. EFB-N1 TaxID=1658766 RepID=UPI00064E0124|nr:2,3-butanediol dehydrogenase [Fructobacillus sp. EFB-N1]KMK53318.1 Sorbitol dehydrogenase [Fructobacillus sp. EFB-N1]